MVIAKKYVVKKYFEGLPKPEDYDIVEEILQPIKAGGIVVRAEWISVDPYLRAYNRRTAVPYDQYSYQVGVVEESKNPDYPIGTRVVTHKGWSNYTVIYPKEITAEETIYKLPDLRGLSNSLGVGAVGMPGATAYFGFLELCKPKPGETVVVTGAAGAVGSIVGQIAKIKGCKVIGFTGSDDKVQWLEKELGFDKAINYKTANVAQALKEAAPNGVDCYFDNVGGDLSSAIIYQMNLFGRVAVCGSISAYNEDVNNTPKANLLQPAIVAKQLRIEGFIVHRWRNQWPRAFADIVQWIESGKLVAREHVTEGFDNIFNAFVGMLQGENIGKAVVKV